LTGFTVGNEIFVGFAPERTIEGKAIEELRTLPQVVAASSSAGTRIISDFFSKVSQEVITVDTLESAEMVKLISNSYRDLTFAFSNSIALAASKHNVDVYELITAANQNYERNHIPLPSPGVGGYCLTKDPYLYAQGCSENKDIMNLMHAGRIINSAMPKHVADIADSFIRHLGISDVTVVVVGLAFKSSPPTSDVRFSPSIELVKELQNAGIDDIYAYDPHVLSNVYTEHGIKEIEQFEDAITCGDIIVFMHGDQMYADKNVLDVLRKRKGEQLLIDTWGLFAGKIKSSVHGVDYANLSYKTF
jgi:UDP-N-acetyl-D-mannosaminuronic acid dehydrogenase